MKLTKNDLEKIAKNSYFQKTGINKNEKYIYLPVNSLSEKWFQEHYNFIKYIRPKNSTNEFERILAEKKEK